MPIRLRAALASCLFALLALARPALAAWPTDPTAFGQLIGTTGSGSNVLSAKPDGAGGMFVAWQDGRNGIANFDIYAQHYDANGNALWTAGGVVACNAAGNQTAPQLLADGMGGVYIAWVDDRTVGVTGDDVYATRLLAGGTLAGGWTANGIPVCTAGGNQNDIAISVDQNSNLFLAWEDGRTSASTGADIVAQKLNYHGGVSWTSNGVTLCNATGNQTQPTVTFDLSGGAYFAWLDSRTSGSPQVYARYVSSAGVAGWTPNGTLLSDASTTSEAPILVPTNGTAMVLYSEFFSGSSASIIADGLLNPSGVLGQGSFTDGTTLDYLIGAQPDGASGVMVAWFRYGGSFSVYGSVFAQHVDSGDGFMWGSFGAMLASGPLQFASGARFVPDGTGGATIAWNDDRRSTTSAFAQRVDRNGNVMWDPLGVPVYTGPYWMESLDLAPDNAGNTLVAYSTQTNSTSGLAFLRRLDRFGVQGDPSPVMTRAKDVPNDQGGQLSLQWTASYLDAYPNLAVAQYTIWRKAPSSLAQAAASAGHGLSDGAFALGGRRVRAVRDPASGTVTYWEQIATQAARALPGYSYTASTTSDSLPGSNPLTWFMVMAETSGGAAFWASAPDSGYSVDNLPPLPPAPVTGTYAAGTTSLHWRANGEHDLASYRVYRGTSAAFTPTPANRIADEPDTSLVDPMGGYYYYKLSAVDAHGNESGFTTLQPTGTLGVGDGTAPVFAFARPSPNPAVAATTLRFTLPRAGRATLTVHDAAGRLVRTLLDGAAGAGEHALAWRLDDAQGRPVAPGLYFLRLENEGRELVERLVATR